MVLLIEPVSNIKRRRYSEVLAEPKRRSDLLTLTEVKQRLREIRRYSLDNQESLLTGLMSGLATQPDIEVVMARDQYQAIENIRRIAVGARIAVNKSTVVKNELVPALTARGYDIIDSYYDEFDASAGISSEYWQLVDLPFETRFQSFSGPVDLTKLRSESLRENGAKGFIGLLGINAVSAKDGTLYLLQHMQNISEVFEQARGIILVAGLDKIVANPEDADFQTRCMAVFGTEVLSLGLGGRGRQPGGIHELPFDVPLEKASSKIHLIILDNGRSRVLKGPYRELLTCIDCQACIKDCPTSHLFNGSSRWSPRSYAYYFITGITSSLDSCLQCKSCESNCPLEIDLPGIILDAKTSHRRRSLTDRLIAKAGTLEGLGSAVAWLANGVLTNVPLRWMAEKVLNISRQRQLPGLRQRTFARWFVSRERCLKATDHDG